MSLIKQLVIEKRISQLIKPRNTSGVPEVSNRTFYNTGKGD